MKRLFIVLALIAAALVAALLRFVSGPAAPAPQNVETVNASPPAIVAIPEPAQESDPPPAPVSSAEAERPDPRKAGSPLAANLNAPASDAQHDVEALQGMLRQYLRLLHRRQGLPIGNDSDLARVLTGHNPMKLVILPSPHPALSPDGRLRDRWGTPYFIHPRGNMAFEIRSAGPDRKLWTPDDVKTGEED